MDYLYAKLNDIVVPVNYTGGETDTATVNVDQDKRIISVDIEPNSSIFTGIRNTIANRVELSCTEDTYEVTVSLFNTYGDVISTSTIDLPIEKHIVDGHYDSSDMSIVLVLKDQSEIRIPADDLIKNLVTTDTTQIISGSKTFNSSVSFKEGATVSKVLDDNFSAVNRKYVDDNLIKKLDVSSTITETDQLYCKTASGEQGMYSVKSGVAEANTVPSYNDGGKLVSNDPDSDNEVVNKHYADATFAKLNESGKIDPSQLPEYTSSVYEYSTRDDFPSSGYSSVLYIDKSTNLIYRWDSTQYVLITSGVQLGETASTAFPGDRGKSLEDTIVNKLDKTSVSQTLGEDTELVASQKCVTDALNEKIASSSITEKIGSSSSLIMSQKGVTDNFLQKLTNDTTWEKVYSVSTDGSQSSLSVSKTTESETIVQRDSTGCVKVGSPQSTIDATNKKYVDDKFTDTVIQNTLEVLNSSKKTLFKVSETGDTTFSSNISISGTPSEDSHVTTKKYVDDNFLKSSDSNKFILKDSGVVEEDGTYAYCSVKSGESVTTVRKKADSAVSPLNIVSRGADSEILVRETPTLTNEAASKSYIDINAAHGIQLSFDEASYSIKAQLKNSANTLLDTEKSAVIPIGDLLVGGSYNSANKSLQLTAKNGTTSDVSLSGLIEGLAKTSDLSSYASLSGTNEFTGTNTFVSNVTIKNSNRLVTQGSTALNHTDYSFGKIVHAPDASKDPYTLTIPSKTGTIAITSDLSNYATTNSLGQLQSKVDNITQMYSHYISFESSSGGSARVSITCNVSSSFEYESLLVFLQELANAYSTSGAGEDVFTSCSGYVLVGESYSNIFGISYANEAINIKYVDTQTNTINDYIVSDSTSLQADYVAKL